nr:DUF3575 domain-containing protein [Prevotella sp.]
MKIWNRLALVAACVTALSGNASKCFAQGSTLYYNKVDSLSFGQRISLRTNLASWAELTPNLGVEFTIGNRNWSKWTLGVYGRANWKTKTTELAYNVYDVYDGRVQLRKYWHGAKDSHRVFYWGVYAGVNKYDIKFTKTGYRGNGYIGGAMLGTISQLYGYRNGASLDLDLGLNAGVLYGKMEKYHRVKNEAGEFEYKVDSKKENQLITEALPMAASMDLIHMGLIYHFGTTVPNRYKRRIEIDDSYRFMLAEKKHRLDSLNVVYKRERAIKRDSLAEVDYEKRFTQQRQDIEDAYRKREAELLKQRDQFLKEEKDAEEKKKAAADAKAAAEKKAADEKVATEKVAADKAAASKNASNKKKKTKK